MKFSFLKFVLQRGTETRSENRSRHKPNTLCVIALDDLNTFQRMELNNVKTEEFKSTGLSLIQQSGEILTLVRYPFRGGDKDYFLIDSDQGFKEFLDNRKPKDSVTIFKTFDFLKEGLVTQDFIDETLTQLNSIKSTDWLLIFLGQEKQKTNCLVLK
jgi:hypothetical protein